MDKKIEYFLNQRFKEIKSKRQPLARCRMAIYYYLRSKGLSFPLIGEMLDVDHSTVIHGNKKVLKNITVFTKEIDEFAMFYENQFMSSSHYGKPIFESSEVSLPKLPSKNIFELRGYACQICGYDEVVEIHHVFGRKQGNNDDNLLLVCPNCHKRIHLGLVYFKDSIIHKPFNII